MPLSAGDKIGPYEILAPLGQGGMGEVYRARDLKLQRDVAIKVLPSAVAADPERLARFEREARTLASLNHPHIAAIYGVEQGALVMELVEGRMPVGPMELDVVIDLARQMADGLEAAHEKGIIHRDLKPANIKITPEGVVKLLDFGLAKALESSPKSSDPETSPTLTQRASLSGMILGTAGYMSPEQARGGKVDRRTDIWAFGVVLYEMFTAKKAFAGETISDTLAAVLTREIDLGDVPARMRPLLRRCLERDPRKRLGWIGEARALLDAPPPPVAPPRRRLSSPWFHLAWAGLAAVLLWAPWRTAPEIPPMARLVIENPEGELSSIGNSAGSAISPDGRVVAYVALAKGSPVLHVRSLEALQSRVLAGTEGAGRPFWSPDSRSIGYFANGKLMRIDLSGGAPQTICDAAVARGGTWNKEGVILFAGRQPGGLQRVPASGGVPVPVTELDAAQGEDAHYYPQFLPDGRQFLYFRRRARDAAQAGVFAGRLDNTDRGRNDKKLFDTRYRVVYASGHSGQPGYLLLIRGTTAFAQRFDAARLQTLGEPIVLAESVSLIPPNAFSDISASDNGVVAYGIGSSPKRVLVWKDRTGKDLGARIEFPDVGSIRISPDGKRVAAARNDGSIWVTDLERNTSTRLLFEQTAISPLWSPDGQKIAFWSPGGLYVKAADGAGEAELLLKGIGFTNGWSQDGRFLVFNQITSNTQSDIWALPMTGDRKPVPLVTGKASEYGGSVTADGRWLAYQSDETGRPEVYVQGFPQGKGKWMISTGGGLAPHWRSDGKELVYAAPDGMIMAAPIQASERGIAAGTPVPLFRSAAFRWDMTTDAKRFIVIESAEGEHGNPLVVLLHWQENLKR